MLKCFIINDLFPIKHDCIEKCGKPLIISKQFFTSTVTWNLSSYHNSFLLTYRFYICVFIAFLDVLYIFFVRSSTVSVLYHGIKDNLSQICVKNVSNLYKKVLFWDKYSIIILAFLFFFFNGRLVQRKRPYDFHHKVSSYYSVANWL